MQAIDRYFDIVRLYPNLFKNSGEVLDIVLDKKALENYSKKKQVGVIYENDYYIFMVDLVKNSSGDPFAYFRILNRNTKNGVVIIPKKEEKFCLLKQFRHGTREYELEFPRGFSESNMSSEENALKELSEEIGANAVSISYEGNIISDSGLTGGVVDIFTIQIDEIRQLSYNEGIKDIIWVSLDEIKQLIKHNEIRDSFTISSIQKYFINREMCKYV